MKIKVKIDIPPIVPMRLKGSKAEKELDALLDTGSTYVIISWEDALEMGYDPSRAPETQIATGGGMIKAPLIVLDSVEVFGFKKTKVEAVVKDLTEVGIDSVLGWSFLEDFTILIDSKKGILEMEGQDKGRI